MFLSISISDFIQDLFRWILLILLSYLNIVDDIIILDLEDFSVSLLDFSIGLLVIAIVIGAFVRVNKADTFYNNRKD